MLTIKFARHRESENVYAKNRESSSIKSNCMFTTENPINNRKYIIKKYFFKIFGKKPRPPNFERYTPVERTAGTNGLSNAELV